MEYKGVLSKKGGGSFAQDWGASDEPRIHVAGDVYVYRGVYQSGKVMPGNSR